ncbi:uncharacterized protein [Primulina huaijiensis]|uniref:uncharacterized protein n=1 Tax=Primulina huaijiensis TaxID=1492673 RepID=UPI003CC774CA
MPTIIVVHFDDKWEVSKAMVYKWNPGPNAKFVVILVDDDTCYFENLKSELYRAGKVDDTANLRLSYLLESSCNIQPIYIAYDHDLKAYLYFDCPKSRSVLQVEMEHVNDASFDVSDNVHRVGIDEYNINFNEYRSFDDYFDLKIVSLDRNNTSEFFDEAHNVDVIYVDRSNTTELYNEARDVNVINGVEVKANVVASNETNVVAYVNIINDTFSFTDGSNLFVGQEFPNGDAVKKESSRISLEACFEFETVKSSQKMYAVKCIVSGCKWRIWTSKIKNDSQAFSVRTYCNTHTCGLTGRRTRICGASSAVVRDMLVDNF